jgi:cell division protease FtsH
LENMLNESAILAARENKKEIDMKDIEEAAMKVKLGPEKKRLQTDMDRKMTAYHEAGHAVVTYYSANMDSVHRISIVSRGMALGYTLTPPEKDRLHETKSHLIDQIATMMGGRAAEQLIFKEMTSGAANDIDQATRIARYMVMEFGMSDLGPINFGPQMDVTEWGRQFMEQNQISPDMMGAIDREVKKLVDAGYAKAEYLLKKYKSKLDKIAQELIKKETIESDEFEALMADKAGKQAEKNKVSKS